MFIFKRNLSLNDTELNEIKKFVSITIEEMLTTREETLNIFKQYDLVLICSWEGNYLIMDIYQLSKFTISDRTNIRDQNRPYYSAACSLDHRRDTIVYFDEHREKGLVIKNLLAFYYVCDLMQTLDIEVFSAQEYKCTW